MPNNELKKRSTASTSAKKKDKEESSSSKVKVIKEDKKNEKEKSQPKEDESIPPPPRFGPLPGISKHRLWSRAALILGLMTIVYFTSGKNEESFADLKQVKAKSMETKCSPEFSKSKCQGQKCGRFVSDVLITGEEVFALIDLCRRGFVSHPGVSVMDLGQRALKFGGLVKPLDGIFQQGDSAVFQSVKSKLQRVISAHFGIDYWKLNLASPVFLSMVKPGGKDISVISSHEKTLGYTYSAIVFLMDYDKDFQGGKFLFIDSDNTNRTVVPLQGRVLAFTSGDENRFCYEKMYKGLSYALTLGFTCDNGMKDPTF